MLVAQKAANVSLFNLILEQRKDFWATKNTPQD